MISIWTGKSQACRQSSHGRIDSALIRVITRWRYKDPAPNLTIDTITIGIDAIQIGGIAIGI